MSVLIKLTGLFFLVGGAAMVALAYWLYQQLCAGEGGNHEE